MAGIDLILSDYLMNREREDLTGFAGVNPQGLNQEFAQRMAALIYAAEKATAVKATINEGYRSNEYQAKIYANRANNPNPVAPPGKSLHNVGLGMDIKSSKARDWMAKNASKFGILWGGSFNDPPHFELARTKSGAPAPIKSDLAKQYIADVAWGPAGAPVPQTMSNLVAEARQSGDPMAALTAINQATGGGNYTTQAFAPEGAALTARPANVGIAAASPADWMNATLGGQKALSGDSVEPNLYAVPRLGAPENIVVHQTGTRMAPDAMAVSQSAGTENLFPSAQGYRLAADGTVRSVATDPADKQYRTGANLYISPTETLMRANPITDMMQGVVSPYGLGRTDIMQPTSGVENMNTIQIETTGFPGESNEQTAQRLALSLTQLSNDTGIGRDRIMAHSALQGGVDVYGNPIPGLKPGSGNKDAREGNAILKRAFEIAGDAIPAKTDPAKMAAASAAADARLSGLTLAATQASAKGTGRTGVVSPIQDELSPSLEQIAAAMSPGDTELSRLMAMTKQGPGVIDRGTPATQYDPMATLRAINESNGPTPPVYQPNMAGRGQPVAPIVSPELTAKYGALSSGTELPPLPGRGDPNDPLGQIYRSTLASGAGAANALIGPVAGLAYGIGGAFSPDPIQGFLSGYEQGSGDVNRYFDPTMQLDPGKAIKAGNIATVGSLYAGLPIGPARTAATIAKLPAAADNIIDVALGEKLVNNAVDASDLQILANSMDENRALNLAETIKETNARTAATDARVAAARHLDPADVAAQLNDEYILDQYIRANNAMTYGADARTAAASPVRVATPAQKLTPTAAAVGSILGAGGAGAGLYELQKQLYDDKRTGQQNALMENMANRGLSAQDVQMANMANRGLSAQDLQLANMANRGLSAQDMQLANMAGRGLGPNAPALRPVTNLMTVPSDMGIGFGQTPTGVLPAGPGPAPIPQDRPPPKPLVNKKGFFLGSPEGTRPVLSGETLGKIAKSYDMTAKELAALNKIPNANKVMVGARLVVPIAKIGSGNVSTPTGGTLTSAQRTAIARSSGSSGSGSSSSTMTPAQVASILSTPSRPASSSQPVSLYNPVVKAPTVTRPTLSQMMGTSLADGGPVGFASGGQIVGTNGYVYEKNSSGGYTNVGKVAGMSDAQLYDAANAGAFNSKTGGGANPSSYKGVNRKDTVGDEGYYTGILGNGFKPRQGSTGFGSTNTGWNIGNGLVNIGAGAFGMTNLGLLMRLFNPTGYKQGVEGVKDALGVGAADARLPSTY